MKGFAAFGVEHFRVFAAFGVGRFRVFAAFGVDWGWRGLRPPAGAIGRAMCLRRPYFWKDEGGSGA
jgi:hypothetical protein